MELLKDLQRDVQGRLMSCPDFAHVAVLLQEGNGGKKIETLRDTLNRVLSGLSKTNGKSGLSVLIPMPEVRVESNMQGVPGPQINVRISVQVIENETINRSDKGTGITAESLAFTILGLGHLFQCRATMILIADEKAIEAAELDDEMAGTVAYQINFTSPMSTEPYAKCTAPTLDVTSGSLSITGQSGAEHYFTLDGSFPRPGVQAAQLYAAPVAVQAGTVIRAATYLTEYTGSDVTELTA
jgi:hypothetical protein